MSEAVRIVARKPEAKRDNLVSGRQKAASHFANSPADRILLLQKTIGNQAVQRLIESGDLQAKLKIGSPGDIYEQEADRMAEQVMQIPEQQVSKETWIPGHTQNIQRRCSGCIKGTKSRKEEEIKVIQAKEAPGSTPEPVNESHINATRSGGQPLPESVRSFYEPRFGADFSQVRVHTGSQAAETAKSINAKAFTVGQNIAFGGGQYAPGSHEGRKLLAHELTHTIQQGPGVQREPLIQRDEKESSWWDEYTNFGETTGWTLLRKFAPSVVPIVEKGPEGVFDWLKERAGNAAEGIFTSLMTPVRVISGVGQQLSAQFAPLLASVQEAGAKIARNDCSPIREAAEKIENTAERLITPIVEKLQPVVAKVKDFLNGLWDKLGAPIWDLIQQYASAQWAQIKFIAGQIQAAANWIWNKTASLRSLADKAWTWLKNKLGIGEGAEGQDGILQWVQRKLDTAWTWLKAKLEPFKKELTTIGLAVGGVALALSPAGPVLAIGAAVVGAAKGLRWIYTNWGKGNIIVQSRVFIEKTLIPPLQGAANRLGAAITRTAGSINSALNNFAAGMARAVGSLGGSLLGFAVSAVQWIADQVTSLADWAQQQLGQLSQWMTGALDKLQIFLHQMLNFFAKVGMVVLDIWGLPVLLGEKVWNWVPSCVRDPIVDFLVPIILRQIEIFQELVKDDGAWQKTKAEVGKIIKLVFKDHDLMGAVRATFYLILRVFNLPPDLLVTVAQKALSAWDMVVKKPLDFIKNTVRALGHGFRLLWADIWTHLAFGVQGWLLGEIKEKNIKPPEKWTDPAGVFFFVLDVLGLSVDHIYELLKKRLHFDDKKVEAFRKRIGQFGRVLDWINKTIDTTKSPQENVKGMIGQAKDFGTSILTGIVEWIAGKVAGELAMMAAAAAASAGLSEVIDIARRIYKAILTAVRWARRILDMANEALGNVIAIASGAIEGVGVKFKDIMHNGMPVIIGFLADQVGLGGVGQALRNIIDKLREQVDKAILWLIDKIKAGIEALIGLFKGEDGDEMIESPFDVGKEHHTLRVKTVNNKLDLQMSSGLLMEFSDRLEKIKAEWGPLRHSHPAGNLEKELDQLSIEGSSLITNANKKRTERAQSRALNKAINVLAVRLRDICQRFGITRLEGISNYREPPPHFPQYVSPVQGRAQKMLVTLSFNTRPFMKDTNPSAFVPGTNIEKGYERGHLLAASLGGSNSNPGNFAPMSKGTNISRGGIANFEFALREALKKDVYPPWIVEFGIECVYTGSVANLQSIIDSLFGPQPGTAATLFTLAQKNTEIDLPTLKKVFPSVKDSDLEQNQQRIRTELLMNFTPRRFRVTNNIVQSPEGERLPAAQSFDNHL
jgi:hypothetical protein